MTEPAKRMTIAERILVKAALDGFVIANKAGKINNTGSCCSMLVDKVSRERVRVTLTIERLGKGEK